MSFSTPFVRNLLLLDAATCAVMGLLLVAAYGFIAGLTGIPSPLLLWAGVVLFPVAAFIALVGTRRPPPAAGILLIVIGNAAWVIGSVLLLVMDWIAPNALGVAFIAVQAAAVALFAVLEQRALSGGAAAPHAA